MSEQDNNLRIFPKVRQIPEKKPKTFIVFPFEVWEKRRGTFEEKDSESMELIKNHLKEFKKCHVMSSHGSDSIVLVHMIKRACDELQIPMIDVWLNHTLNLFKEEQEYWKIINKFLGIEKEFKIFMPPKDDTGRNQTVWTIAEKVGHLPSFRKTSRKKSMSYKHSNTPECCDILKKKSVKDYLKQLPKDERFDCVFIGTRAQESQIRFLGVLQRCRSYTQTTRVPYPKRVVTPLSYWEAVDILEYYHRYNIPRNPVYKIHNVDRMGCASCPAHINWEIRLAQDPTNEGFGMLKQNFKIMKNTEPQRFSNSIDTLDKWLNSKKSKDLDSKMRVKLEDFIKSQKEEIKNE